MRYAVGARGDLIAFAPNPADPGFCPAVALQAWLRHLESATDIANIGGPNEADDRPLFCAVTKGGRLVGIGLSDKAVVRLIKQAAGGAGLDPSCFACHSLRAALPPPRAMPGWDCPS